MEHENKSSDQVHFAWAIAAIIFLASTVSLFWAFTFQRDAYLNERDTLRSVMDKFEEASIRESEAQEKLASCLGVSTNYVNDDLTQHSSGVIEEVFTPNGQESFEEPESTNSYSFYLKMKHGDPIYW